MKKPLVIILTIVMALFGFTACSNDPNKGDGVGGGKTPGNETVDPPGHACSYVLIAYFSCTNNTEGVAEHIEAETNGELYEIVPEVPYTAADLNYYHDCRADKEQADSSARPAISGNVENMDKYGVVFLGYPIWHGQAPRIISTFLESYDFSGKTIVPFCTSQSSGIGNSDTNLHALAPDAEWIAGRRFAPGASRQSVGEWIDALDLKLGAEQPDKQEVSKMFISVNGNKLEVTLVENSATAALVERLKRGDITYTADDYGGFEKVGSLGFGLPTENSVITTQAGDVVLYSGDQVVLFYGSNSWSYTRLGRIEGYTASELRTLLGAGKGRAQVTLSLE